MTAPPGSLRAELIQSIQPRRLVPLLVTGLILAILDFTTEISFAALIFNGQLSGYYSAGVGYILAGAVVLVGVTAIFSSFRGAISIPQDAPAVFTALIVASIAGTLISQGESQSVLPTVIVTISLISIITGLAFFGIGLFRLGNLIRFIPYPVVGGFLAGTGWLLFSGGIVSMTGIPLTFSSLPALFQPEMLILWLPGVIYGLGLFLAARKINHFLVTPIATLAAVLIFYLILFLSGGSVASAREIGLVISQVPTDTLWSLPPISDLALVQWDDIFAQTAQILTVVLISVISLLLNASGLELDTRQTINLNQELRANGAANMLAALVGSPPGYDALSYSSLSSRMTNNNRLVGVVMMFGLLGFLLFGAVIISYIPIFIMGGTLVFLGLLFLVEWLYDAWFKLSPLDYSMVVLILLVIAAFGVLPGVGLGLFLSAGIFIVEFSRINVVNRASTACDNHSRLQRSEIEYAYLREHGDRIDILELQSYLFFGTANRLFDQIQEKATDLTVAGQGYLILDFRRVSGLDASAVLSFSRLAQKLQAENKVLVFTQLSPSMRTKLDRGMQANAIEESWQIFPDLDLGLEWCEGHILAGLGEVEIDMAKPETTNPVVRLADEAKLLVRLQKYLTRMELKEGDVIIRQGQPASGLYFVFTGQLTAVLEHPGGEPTRLQSMGEGYVVGELGVYLNQPASATVLASKPSVLYYLPAERLKELEADNPQTANVLQQFVIRVMGERLLGNLETVKRLSN